MAIPPLTDWGEIILIVLFGTSTAVEIYSRFFRRPKVELTKLEILEDQPMGYMRGQIQKGDYIVGEVVNYGEPAKYVTASVIVEGKIPKAEPLMWPFLQPQFTPEGNYPTYLPELGKDNRAEFRFAERQGNKWRFCVNPVQSRNIVSELEDGKTFNGFLVIHEGSGGHQIWKFTLAIDTEGKAKLIDCRKIRRTKV